MVQTELKNSEQHEINLDDEYVIGSYEEFEKLLILIEEEIKQDTIKGNKRGREKLLAKLIERAQFNPKYPEDKITRKKSKQAYYAKFGEPNQYFFM